MPEVSMPLPASYRGKGSAPYTFTPRGIDRQSRAARAEALPATRAPRPKRTSRYPISMEAFAQLKTAARRPRPVARRFGVMSADRAGAALAPTASVQVKVSGTLHGIPSTGWLPWDCALAVGKNHIVAAVNSTIAIYDKAGAKKSQETLDDWFADKIKGATIFDPKLVYDPVQQRFVLLAVATKEGTQESWFLLSVSQTSDPTGPWWNYPLDASPAEGPKTWADYPCLGLDADALYLTGNSFVFDGDFHTALVRVVPKAAVYSGGTPVFSDFTGLTNGDGSHAFTVQPCVTFSGKEYLVNTILPTPDNEMPDKISLWEIDDPAGTPSLSLRTIQVDAYGLPPQAQQPGGVQELDSGDVRVLNAVHKDGSIWAAFSTQHTWPGANASVCAVFWVEIDSTSAAVQQQGVFGAAGSHYFYPAVMPEGGGGLVVVFSRSSTTESPSLYGSSRGSGDPAGTLRGSTKLKAGTSPYVSLDGEGRNRWGDYAAVALDPADATKVWLSGGFSSGASHWDTVICEASV